MNREPTYLEFFAGGGMARAGLAGWRCLFANDIDPKKRDAYVANWGDAEFRLADIFSLKPADLPERADLAWASFPCQDLSLAGNGAGLNAGRSGAFWGFWRIMHGLKHARRAPKILVLENVGGVLSSHGGKDFAELCRAIRDLGYVVGALMIDAVHFVPQSRPRVFFVAVAKNEIVAPSHVADEPSEIWSNAALRRAYAALPNDLKKSWRWWRLPPPPKRNVALMSILLKTDEVEWHRPEETRYLLSLMAPLHRERIAAMKKSGAIAAGTIYKRTRPTADGGRTQRAETRFDNVAGCLRTPGGGSSRQTVIVIEKGVVRTRLLAPREAARLMGLPDSYKLPEKYNDAYHLMGDGLAVPAVRFLAENLLSVLLFDKIVPQIAAE